jgi:hypothetical protein
MGSVKSETEEDEVEQEVSVKEEQVEGEDEEV